jgi:DNA-binding NtrC family response regulator
MGTILIVDDEQEMREISYQIFRIEGYEVDTAADAESAMFKIKNNKYDFLLVDLVLPGRLNGLDIIKKVRQILPKIKIIAYSGFSGIDIAEKVIRAGANNFLAKPFRRQEIISVVNGLHNENKFQHEMIN